VQAGDWQGVRNAAHALKSAAHVAGVAELESLCRRLEQAHGTNAQADADRLPQAARAALVALGSSAAATA
jgi:HPt (histidine-containing phosphotransfer) domain-containing protein